MSPSFSAYSRSLLYEWSLKVCRASTWFFASTWTLPDRTILYSTSKVATVSSFSATRIQRLTGQLLLLSLLTFTNTKIFSKAAFKPEKSLHVYEN